MDFVGWGRGDLGSLGYANPNHITTADQFPPPDVELGGDVERIWAHHGSGTCALLVDVSLRCWGQNDQGQIGYGHAENIGDDETPASAGPVPF